MDSEINEEIRLEMLCKRMGRMWNEKIHCKIEETVVAGKIKDGSLTLIGKLYQNPRINFQAFQQTMKKVWRTENSEFIPLEDGVFAVSFATGNEMRKVQEQGPWSFANSLLMLQPWRPDTTAMAYKFTSCLFWVHVMGVPFEWGTKDFLREVVSGIGDIHDASMVTKGMITYGRIRVNLNLDKPLQSGILACHGGRRVWLDFKYERLPKFCYLCGKIGHYLAECDESHNDQVKGVREEERLFGPWLKAEEDEKSPFWKIFYDEIPVMGVEDEGLLNNAGQLVIYAENKEHARCFSEQESLFQYPNKKAWVEDCPGDKKN